MRKHFLLLAGMLSATTISTLAQTVEMNYPTGTSWVECWMENEDVLTTHTYRIGEPTVQEEKTYRTVLMDGVECGKWIREEKGCLWLLTEEFPKEIMIYDFNMEAGKENIRQYVQDGEIKEDAFMVSSIGSILLENGQRYDYTEMGETKMVKSIGVLSERRKDCCILGYLMPETILPDLSVCLLQSFCRNGEIVYRNALLDTGINRTAPSNDINKSNETYDLSGRRITGSNGKGIYIRNGQKVIRK